MNAHASATSSDALPDQDQPAPGSLTPAEAVILLCDPLDPTALEVLRARGFDPVECPGLSEDQLVLRAADAHAIVVRSATKVTRRVLEAAPRLIAVGRAGIGVDNIDVAAATERGVVVMNTPAGNVTTTAEHALALLMSLARHVPRAMQSVRSGSWGKKHLVGTELEGKTLGVIGFGRIGRIVADRARGLGMRVLVSDPYLSADDLKQPGIDLVELDELLPRADFVTLHVPLGDSTRNLLSRERIATMKPGARLINAARGGLVDEVALLEALEAGRLAGAALDVLAQEPPAPDHPLLARDDVIVTPHLGASSHEAQTKVAEQIAAQLADFITEGVAQNAVNAPAVSPQTVREVGPYALLAERLGSLLAQLLGEPVRKIELTVAGEAIERHVDYLKTAVLVGVLRRGMGAGINFVNAPHLARERGLRVLESVDSEAHSFTNLIKVRVSSRGGADSHLAAGTVFGRKPMIVRVDDVHLDLPPEGAILITRHRDRPGVLGLLGTTLGERGVNIARVELAPGDGGDAGGLASAFLSLDDEPDADTLARIESLEPIEGLRLVRLT